MLRSKWKRIYVKRSKSKLARYKIRFQDIRSKYEDTPSNNDLIKAINLVSILTANFIQNERPTFAISRKMFNEAEIQLLEY